MEIYGGPLDAQKFHVHGLVAPAKVQSYAKITKAMIEQTEHALAFMAFKLGLNDLFLEIVEKPND
jgi:hypothetical protein